MSALVNRPPGPNGGIFGVNNLVQFQRDSLGFITRAAEDFGDLSYFRMAAFHFYLINSPDYVYETLVAQGSKIEKWQRQTNTWSKAVGASTLTMEGDEWKRHRRLLSPAFHSQTVKRYTDLIIEHTDRLRDRWQDHQVYEMMFEMMRTTMGIIADIIFSVKNIEQEAAELNQALTAVFEVLTARTTAFQQTPLWLPTPENRRIHWATQVIEKFIMNLIHERRQEGKDYGDILSDLMNARDAESGSQLSDQEICYELKTLFGAGHETTALMLMWTLYLLAQNPAVDEKLFHETTTVLGDRYPALEDLPGMPYTEQTLTEAMRLFPPAWSLMVRRAKQDLQLGETTVPRDSVLLIPMWTVHRDARIYADPLKFDPGRFAPDPDGRDWKKRYHKYAYFPFGGGPHICIGNHLAMLEGKLILPMLIQRYRFELAPQAELKLQALLTLRPKNGLRIKVLKRG